MFMVFFLLFANFNCGFAILKQTMIQLIDDTVSDTQKHNEELTKLLPEIPGLSELIDINNRFVDRLSVFQKNALILNSVIFIGNEDTEFLKEFLKISVDLASKEFDQVMTRMNAQTCEMETAPDALRVVPWHFSRFLTLLEVEVRQPLVLAVHNDDPQPAPAPILLPSKVD